MVYGFVKLIYAIINCNLKTIYLEFWEIFMYNNLLFDLDGTLTNSAEGITKCVQYGLNKIGIVENDLSKLEVFIGPPLRSSYMKYYGLSKEEAETCVTFYRERYEKIGIWENKVYPGIIELLGKLQRNGKKMGMATGKPEIFAKQIATRFGFNDYLDAISGSSLDGKMDDKALVVAEALKKWQITSNFDKKDVVLIGDRREDVLAAHANGIACIGVGFGFGSLAELNEVGVEYYAANVEDLTKLLLD